jgi:hypothetical protein
VHSKDEFFRWSLDRKVGAEHLNPGEFSAIARFFTMTASQVPGDSLTQRVEMGGSSILNRLLNSVVENHERLEWDKTGKARSRNPPLGLLFLGLRKRCSTISVSAVHSPRTPVLSIRATMPSPGPSLR